MTLTEPVREDIAYAAWEPVRVPEAVTDDLA